MKYLVVMIAIFTIFSCASKKGDSVECPVCDNKTTFLKGTKCVPIAEVEACGPDGHAHGTDCHCFSGQAPTEIDGKEYCIQKDCGGNTDETPEEDVDAHACETVKAGNATSVEGVATIDEFEKAHLELETLYEITLKAGAETYFHTGPATTGDWAVYFSEAGVFDSAYNAEKVKLESESLGANPDCKENLKDLYNVLYTEKEGMGPAIIIKLKAQTEDKKVVVFVHEAGHEHE